MRLKKRFQYYREKEEDFYDLINYANELRLEAISKLDK